MKWSDSYYLGMVKVFKSSIGKTWALYPEQGHDQICTNQEKFIFHAKEYLKNNDPLLPYLTFSDDWRRVKVSEPLQTQLDYENNIGSH